jgi:pilus assembly protein CpaF
MTALSPDLLDRLRQRLDGFPRSPDGGYDDNALASAVRAELPGAASGELLDLTEAVLAELVGAGPLEPLVHQADVTDVLVNGPGPVWVDRGNGVEPSGVLIPDESSVRRLAMRLVGSAGGRLDEAAPFADARLPDGTRVHAVLPPLSPQGTCLSLRVPPRRGFSLRDLVTAGSISEPAAELLRRVVRARLAFLVTGGTGSGKTTVLAALLSQSRPADRVLLVEDCAELRPDLPHVVRLTARPPNVEGAGGISLATLVRQALRMRPDRLVVGEVRGAEVLDLLAALNTGHEGGCGTVHANRPEQLPARIESLCGMAGVGRDAAHSLLAAAVDVVVHLRRDADGRRRVAGLWVLDRTDGSPHSQARPAYRFEPAGITPGPAAADLDRRIESGT